MSINSVKNDSIGQDSVVNAQKPIAPTITNYSVDGVDDEALDPAGGQTVLINGSGFQRGATVTFDGSAIAVVSWVSSSQLSFTAPAKSAGTYNIYVVNSDGGTAIYIPGIIYSTFPTWTTAQGTLGSYYETQSISNSVVATGDAPITYSLISGSLPSGATLASDGTITGTSPTESGSTTYSFTVQADDAELQSSTRSFSLTINTDVVTWVTPSSGATINLDGTAYSQALSATDAAGYSVSYTANALPTGLTLSSGTISGTPTVDGTSSTLLTATAATTNRSATNTITWVVSLSDAYWKYNTLLLSADSSIQPSSFVSDNSIYNAQLTVFGDTKVSNFNPYQNGYYSYTFDGSGDGLTTSASAAFNINDGDWTWEGWVYANALTNANVLISVGTGGSNMRYVISVAQNDGNFYFGTGPGSWAWSSQTTSNNGVFKARQWQHFAVVRYNSVVYFYVDGLSAGSVSGVNFGSAVTGTVFIGSYFNNYNNDGSWFNGFVSNLRFVKGTAVYTSAFTPSTSPLTAISGTSLLTCSSNKVVDISSSPVTLTISGDLSVSSANPFALTTPITTYGSGYFDGTGDYLLTNIPTSLGTANFTMECWVYPNSSGDYIVLDGRSGSNSNKPTLGVVSSQLAYQTSGTNRILAGTVRVKVWSHLAVVRNSNVIYAYVNGVQVGTYSDSSDYGTVTRYMIGADDDGGSNAFFPGYISDCRVVYGTAVYTSAFTPPASRLTAVSGTQLLTLGSNGSHNNSTFTDNSNFSNLSTRTGNPTNGTFSPYGDNWSNYFDGTGDYISASTNALFAFGTGDFTIEAWINYTGALSGSLVPIAQSDAIGTSTNNKWFFAFNNANLFFNTHASGGFSNTIVFSPTVSTWYHVAVTRTSGTIRMFINGESKTVTTTGTPSGYSLSQNGLAIGGMSTPYYMTGYISNFRMVTGSSLYSSSFTPSTTPLTVVTGTSLLTCQSNRLIDNSNNNFTLTRAGDVSVQKFSPFSTIAITKYYSTYFDGTGDYLSIASNSALDGFSGNFTIECWVFFTSTSSGTVLTKGVDSGLTQAPYHIVLNGGNLVFYASSTSTSWNVAQNVLIISSVQTNTWYHVAVTRSGSTIRTFNNGVVSSTFTNSDTLMSSGYAFTIGSAVAGYNRMTGFVSNVRIIKGSAIYTDTFTPSTSPLTITSQGATASQVSLLTCQDNIIVDNSLNKFAITANGDSIPKLNAPFSTVSNLPVSYSASTFGGSMYFDGTGDYLTISTNNISSFSSASNWTVEAWVYSTADASGVYRHILFGSGFSFGIYNNIPYITNNSGGIASVGTLPLNQWCHIAAVNIGGNSLKMYLNGIAGTAVAATSFTSTTTYIGANSSGTQNWQGYISDLRVTDAALYTSNFYPGAIPLTAYPTIGITSTRARLLLNGNSGGVIDATRTVDLETVADSKVTNFSPYNGNYYSIYFTGPQSQSSGLTYTLSTSVLGSGDFTVEVWCYSTAINGYGTLGDLSGSTNFILRYYDTIGWQLYLDNTAHNVTFTSNIPSALGRWIHHAVVRSGTTATWFVNGYQAWTGTSTSNLTSQVYNISNDYAYAWSGYQNHRVVKGTSLYNASASTITIPTTPFTNVANTILLVNGKSFKDLASNIIPTKGNVVTLVPAVSGFNPFQVNTGQSYYFDGTGDYLKSPSVDILRFGNGDFTVEMWFFPTILGRAYVLMNSQAAGGQYGNFDLRTDYMGATSTVFYASASAVDFNSTYNGPMLNQWNHVAFSRSGSNIKLFVNGTVIGSSTNAGNQATTQFTGLSIGGGSALPAAGYDNMAGYLTDIRVTKGYGRYTAAFTPPTIPYKLN